MKKLFLVLYALFSMIVLVGCGATNPSEKLQKQLDQYPEYAIILEDMKVDGNIFKDYYHRYKLLYATQSGDSLTFNSETTDWIQVDEDYFSNYQRYLGMALVSKTLKDSVINTPQPPVYQYVGDERYGRWRTDNNGNSFWEFYGKYALLQSLLGGWNQPIYRDEWTEYRTYRTGNRPYFGKSRQWGTDGTATTKTNPTFFERRQMRERAARQSFSEKLKQRTRRSNMSRSRSRSGGFGK